MTLLAYVVLAAALGLGGYAFVGYPALLKGLALLRRRVPAGPVGEWPSVTITVPVHNGAGVIGGALEGILAQDYPAARRQILVVSDGSTDATDEVVGGFAARGVELLRLPERRGKTAAENAARPHLRGEIIVNTDASVRLHPRAVTALVAAFGDPTVGVASSRDVSVANLDDRTNPGEEAYVGYEMRLRELETAVYGIVGASGSLYAIRRDLHLRFVPEALSRDFGAALAARASGYRAVSVPEAVCYVPRNASLRREYRRKVRTMARGLQTLWHQRGLLNPGRYGVFAWMLWSHKLCRWLVPVALFPAGAALAWLAPGHWWAAGCLALGAGVLLAAGIGWLRREDESLPRAVALPAYAVSGVVAALQAWGRALRGRGTAVWDPTRRAPLPSPAPAEHDRRRQQHDLQVGER